MKAIEVKNISKKYKIIHQRGNYIALRDVITDVFQNPFSFFKRKAKKIIRGETKEEFWALKDINFSVEKGEVVGIIGKNGAGKSTLLKILSQITPPTEGEIIINGTVGSLLEVGTGFHPELSGRDNIFLNGAILGIKKKEIEKKFDEIVKFAGIEQFLDTPVKHYSSGMHVRLAFSVAAHMDPDILIVDEVLAVGDAEFQKKCLGKMNDITKKEGRTILFVSHNMEAIRQLCDKCILLENGKITSYGTTENIIESYLTEPITQKNDVITVSSEVPEKGWVKDSKLIINVTWKKGFFKKGWECDLVFYSIDGTRLFAIQSSLVPGFENVQESSGICFSINNPGLTEKEIRIDIGIRKDINTINYETVINNCLFIKPSTYNIQTYVHKSSIEGLIIPDTTCSVL